MKDRTLNTYVNERLKTVETNLRNYIKDQDPDKLHRIRVEIKKIKAIFSFIKSTSKKTGSFDKLKPLYQKAGEIRELEINIQLLSTLPDINEQPMAELLEQTEGLRREFAVTAPLFFRQIKRFRRKVSIRFELPKNERIKKYFRKMLGKANRSLLEENSESLHFFRSKIKEIMYVYNALPKKMQKLLILNKPYVNRLQQQAGDWHDTYAALDYLSAEDFPGIDEVISKLKLKESGEYNDLKLLTRKLKTEVHI